jgi:hypothetical protein
MFEKDQDHGFYIDCLRSKGIPIGKKIEITRAPYKNSSTSGKDIEKGIGGALKKRKPTGFDDGQSDSTSNSNDNEKRVSFDAGNFYSEFWMVFKDHGLFSTSQGGNSQKNTISCELENLPVSMMIEEVKSRYPFGESYFKNSRYKVLRDIKVDRLDYLPFDKIKKVKTEYSIRDSVHQKAQGALNDFYEFYSDHKELEKKYKKKVEKEKDKERQQIEIEKANKNKQFGSGGPKKELDLLSSQPVNQPPQSSPLGIKNFPLTQ